MRYFQKVVISAGLSLALLTNVAQAAPEINSREYKVLLEPSLFAGGGEQAKAQANNFLAELKTAMAKQGFASAIDKKFKEDKDRNVIFYDTPGTCKLKAANYVARERTRVDNNKREMMVKLRTNSLSQLSGVNLTGHYSDASSKVEADITPGNVVYSYSTKQTIGTEPINSIASLYKLYPNLKTSFNQSGMLAKVSDLMIIEHTYDKPVVTLDGQLFEFGFGLWYVNNVTDPVIAELSFTITEPNGNFPPAAVQKAEKIMNLIAGMNKWAATKSLTKTAWVYQYQPNFCR